MPLDVGDRVTVRPDPDIPDDSNAIAVHEERSGVVHLVGYLPKKLVAKLSPLLPEGATLRGEVRKHRVDTVQEIEIWLDNAAGNGSTQSTTP